MRHFRLPHPARVCHRSLVSYHQGWAEAASLCLNDECGISAGPESLEDYFQKRALLGQKAALNLWCVDTKDTDKFYSP